VTQHLVALERANYVRFKRADLKRRVKRGETDLSVVLGGELPDWLGSMRFGELLESVPRVGPAKAYRYLALVGNVSYTRRLDRLTARQKRDLVLLLAAKDKELERQRGYKRARTKFERGVR